MRIQNTIRHSRHLFMSNDQSTPEKCKTVLVAYLKINKNTFQLYVIYILHHSVVVRHISSPHAAHCRETLQVCLFTFVCIVAAPRTHR